MNLLRSTNNRSCVRVPILPQLIEIFHHFLKVSYHPSKLDERQRISPSKSKCFCSTIVSTQKNQYISLCLPLFTIYRARIANRILPFLGLPTNFLPEYLVPSLLIGDIVIAGWVTAGAKLGSVYKCAEPVHTRSLHV